MTPLKLEASTSLPPEQSNICAIIITYWPDDQFSERVARIIDQVSYLIIVDNGSSGQTRQMLQQEAMKPKTELISNAENKGIAAALNQGASRAIELGYAWILASDQDSVMEPFLVSTLVEIYASHPIQEQIGIMGSNYVHSSTKMIAFVCGSHPHSFQEVEAVITLGMLLSLQVFTSVGPFRDDFFIDQVDDEYCLRIRAHGHKVLISCAPLMVHSLGNLTRHRFAGKNPSCSNHPPSRRYYLTRNRLVLCRRYLFREPRWVFRTLHAGLKDVILIILFEEQKLRKMAAISLGVWHACTGRMGRVELGRRMDAC